MANVAANSFSDNKAKDSWMMPWRCLSLALMEYRRGNYPGAIGWCNRCLTYRKDSAPPRLATIHIVLALAYHQLGIPAQAQAELVQGRDQIDNKLKDGLEMGGGSQGSWFDWVLAQILEREAIAKIENP